MKHTIFSILFLAFSIAVGRAQTEYANPTISIGIIVSDIETSLDFYTKIMGMKETGGFSIDETFGKRSGLSGGTPFDVKILKVVDDPNATELKLVTFGNEKTTPDKHIQDQNGMQYTTYFIKSTDKILQRLKENNIPLLGETPINLPDGRTFILFQDPDGVFVEVIGN
ncbi:MULTISPECIES: VOC family protein [Flavobacteriaceae]|uniref:VOC family protein n=1 Tax=Flavobacteriaceae TaxID=49546 RepID=UPI001490D7F8|nr:MULTISPECIES: VOC family protein [Allomuricauda]MDC6365095.1 VOC family protein [Muricauda sp. AC10]